MTTNATFAATFDGHTLKQALARVAPAVDAKSMMPVLRHCRFTTADDGHVTVTATNLDATLSTTVAATVDTHGSLLVPFKTIQKAVSGASARNSVSVTITSAGEPDTPKFVADVDGVKVTNTTVALDEWPRTPLSDADTNTRSYPFNVDVFATVAGFASDDESRPILTGVYVHDGGVYAGTDSYRLVYVNTHTDLEFDPADVSAASSDGILVPARYAKMFAKHADGPDAVIEVNGCHARIRFPDLDATIRLIEGSFPAYRGLCPASTPASLNVGLGDLVEATDKVHAMYKTVGTSNATPIRFSNGSDGHVSVSMHDTDGGDVNIEVPGTIRNLHAEAVAFNPAYLASILTGAEGTFVGVDPLKPWVLNWTDVDGFDHTRLLMPVRIS